MFFLKCRRLVTKHTARSRIGVTDFPCGAVNKDDGIHEPINNFAKQTVLLPHLFMTIGWTTCGFMLRQRPL